QQLSADLGFPIPLLGYLFYSAVALLAAGRLVGGNVMVSRCKLATHLIVGVAAPFSLYLTWYQFKLSVFCSPCIVSALLVGGLLISQFLELRNIAGATPRRRLAEQQAFFLIGIGGV